MTENHPEDPNMVDVTPTVSQPPLLEPPVLAQAAAQPSTSHTRTILEVVGGVVAVGLIFVAGVGGFVVGHFSGKPDGRHDRGVISMQIERGDAGGRTFDRDGDSQGGPRFQQGGPGMQQGGPQFQQGGPDFQQGGPGMPQGGPQFQQGGPDFQQGGPGMPQDQGLGGTTPSAPLPAAPDSTVPSAPTAPQG